MLFKIIYRYWGPSLFVSSRKEDILSGCHSLIVFPSHKLQVIYSKTYVLILRFCSFMCINFQFYLLFCMHGRWPGCPLHAFALDLKKQVLNPSVMLKPVQPPDSIHTVGSIRLSSCQHTQLGCSLWQHEGWLGLPGTLDKCTGYLLELIVLSWAAREIPKVILNSLCEMQLYLMTAAKVPLRPFFSLPLNFKKS